MLTYHLHIVAVQLQKLLYVISSATTYIFNPFVKIWITEIYYKPLAIKNSKQGTCNNIRYQFLIFRSSKLVRQFVRRKLDIQQAYCILRNETKRNERIFKVVDRSKIIKQN